MSGSRPSYKDDTESFYSYILDCDRSPDEVRQLYDEWAKDYDESMETDRYNAPTAFAEEFDKLGLSKDFRILDACCGTGLFGKLLKSKGYTNIHGLDGSPGMLSIAKSQNVYQSYQECLLTEGTKTSYSDGYFDAVVVCGAITAPGHMGPEAFPELIRITKPGGIISWIGSDHNKWPEKTEKFEEYLKNLYKKIAKLVSDNKWKEYKERTHLPNMFNGLPGFVQFMQVI